MARRSSQITLQPSVLLWARQRAKLSADDLARKVSVKPERVRDWEYSGDISMSQAQKLARITYTPFGYLFLPEPPDESLPIADFRTVGDKPPRQPSPNLLDTVYAMQRRQAWMREEMTIEYEAQPLPFVGAHALTDDPKEVAGAMRDALGIDQGWAASVPNWSAALRRLRDKVEDAGILVFFNGVVGNNTRRPLDRKEFQGFALVDEYAPLIFVNNTDFKAAQMFTLAHELAHIFVGEMGVSHLEDMQPANNDTERFCDKMAAEFLVPESELRACWHATGVNDNPYNSVASQFKVSSIVAARRALDTELISKSAFLDFYEEHQNEVWRSKQENPGGGNFWLNQIWRVGPRFAAAVVCAVKEGRLSYTEAYSLTGLRGNTFENMPEKMGLSFAVNSMSIA